MQEVGNARGAQVRDMQVYMQVCGGVRTVARVMCRCVRLDVCITHTHTHTQAHTHTHTSTHTHTHTHTHNLHRMKNLSHAALTSHLMMMRECRDGGGKER